MLPIAKFAMGCLCYIVSVICTSWHALQEAPLPQTLALLIGIGSMSTVGMPVLFLNVEQLPTLHRLYAKL